MDSDYERDLEAMPLGEVQHIRKQKNSEWYRAQLIDDFNSFGKHVFTALSGVELVSSITPIEPAPRSIGLAVVFGGLAIACSKQQRHITSLELTTELQLRAAEREIDRRVGVHPDLSD